MDYASTLHCDNTTARQRQWVLVVICAAVLVAQIDTAVVNLAVRRLQDYFHAEVSQLQWVVDSYNLVYASLLLTGGLLADMLGRRRIFMWGIGIFTAACAACALAPSVGGLIAARAVAGAGAALAIPASMSIVRVVWRDGGQRRQAMGVWAACNGIALAVGPTLGGILIHAFDWRSVFLVVVPLGLLAVFMARPLIPESADPHGRDADPGAQIMGALGLGSMAYAAICLGGSAWEAAGAAVVSMAAWVAFVATEQRRGARALVPLEIFRVRDFRAAIVATVGMTFGMYGLIFLLPLVWQRTGRLDTIGAGIALLPMALVFVLVSPWSGKLVGRFGRRRMAAGGVAIIGCGLLLVGATASQARIFFAEAGLALTGLGMGMATGPLMDTAVSAVEAARAGTASALVNTARMAGATVGVALLGAVFALGHGGIAGLRAAMLVGGAVQIACALIASRSIGTAPARESKA
ncbi:MFS transporter [Bordetella sp. H567]|uniref:MFS transporter n=1 Tax=Bordetella sp. H567 TaxID=1697043 RepID=UPI00081C5D3B|nr:MFS transporter [Bordetella sp. H567]AOB33322.1 MFS transporter [Bordetella sp. H567]